MNSSKRSNPIKLKRGLKPMNS